MRDYVNMRTSYLKRIFLKKLSISTESVFTPYYKLALVIFMKASFDTKYKVILDLKREIC